MIWKCPKCGRRNAINVGALVTVRLDVNEDGELEGSEPVDGNHEWDGQSVAGCGNCHHAGYVDDFRTDEDED